MQDQNLFLRNDTFMGVCEAIGTDFGFHPNWLRIGFAFALFFNPVVTVGAYLALSVPVAVARFVYPARSAETADQVQPAAETVARESEDEHQMLPLAA